MKVGIVLLLVFVLLPFLSGYAALPHNLTPNELGNCFAAVVSYWLHIVEQVVLKVNPELTKIKPP